MENHGGDIYSRDIRLDFSANINPLGMPESARKALAESIPDFEAYPDPRCAALKRALAKKEGVGEESIVCGSGAADLIHRLAHLLKPERALITAPCFSEYEKALTEAGARVERFYLSEDKNFRLDERILEMIPPRGALFLGCPNNPDGGIADAGLTKKIIERCREKETYFILDECFSDFAEGMGDYPKPPIILKAFTKIYAMAGLRLGYLLCEDKNLAERLSDFGACWSVSTPAQIAGLAALGEEGFIERSVRLIARERKYLFSKLSEAGLEPFPSEANFILFKGPLGLDEKLLAKKIAIRPCGDYPGLRAGFYRTAVRTRAENDRLLDAIAQLTEGERWQNR